jgi:hypothetical protein
VRVDHHAQPLYYEHTDEVILSEVGSDQRGPSQDTHVQPQTAASRTILSGHNVKRVFLAETKYVVQRYFRPTIILSIWAGFRSSMATRGHAPRVGQRRTAGETRSNGVIARGISKSAAPASLTAGALERGRVEPPTGTGTARDAPHAANGCGHEYPLHMQFIGAQHRMRPHSRNTTQRHLSNDDFCPRACRAH